MLLATLTLRPRPEDTIIAVMGVTGTGKSSFVQLFTTEPVGIGSGSQSFTAQVAIFQCKIPNTAEDFYVLDTPSFEDGTRSDQTILCELSSWLTKTYAEDVKLSEIIYLHRIVDVRFSGSSMRNLTMFKKLCGEQGLASVVLATLFWNVVPRAVGEDRELQLISTPSFWGSMIARGSRLFRHDAGEKSGIAIVQCLLGRKRKSVFAIQQEMVDQRKTLEETAAGIELTNRLETQRRIYERDLKDIEQDMAVALRTRDKQLLHELETWKRTNERMIQKQTQDGKKLSMDAAALWRDHQAERERGLRAASEQLKTLEYTMQLKKKQQQQQQQQETESAEQDETYNKELARLKSEAICSALRRSKVRFAKKTVRNDVAGAIL